MLTHRGGCHCGRVRFELAAPARVEVTDCNCSMCARSGYLHLIVPRERFKLLSGAEVLTSYTFNTGTARHLFCSVCGVKSFYVPRSHPEGYSVNARCLDEGTIEDMTIVRKDGKNWEKTYGRD
jgi:centromere protein V